MKKIALDAELVAEIDAIKRRISELQREQDALERVLTRHRLGYKPAAFRKIDKSAKIEIEAAIVKRVVEAPGKLVSTNSLFKAATAVSPNLNPATFRSYLHRLKAASQLESPKRGKWRRPKAT